jgi:hypothetical protein
MMSELLLAHEKLGQFPLLTVDVVPMWAEKYILYQFLKSHHSFVYALYSDKRLIFRRQCYHS